MQKAACLAHVDRGWLCTEWWALHGRARAGSDVTGSLAGFPAVMCIFNNIWRFSR